MVVRDKPNLINLFLVIHGSIVPRILPQIFIITLIGTVVALVDYYYPSIFPNLSVSSMALLGISLSIFLGFRNNACYGRWWEARQLWGQLIVDSRSLSRQIISYVDNRNNNATKVQNRLVFLTVAFNIALRHKMRETDPWTDISRYLEPDDITVLKSAHNVPDMILRLMADKLGKCKHKGMLSDFLVQNLDDRITSMATAQAGCERIKNTPLPFAYMLLVQRTAYLYCLLLPFGIVSALGMVTPVFCAIVAYTFFGLDALSGELEEPFGLAPNDLALNFMTTEIEIELLESVGEHQRPNPVEPVDFQLK